MVLIAAQQSSTLTLVARGRRRRGGGCGAGGKLVTVSGSGAQGTGQGDVPEGPCGSKWHQCFFWPKSLFIDYGHGTIKCQHELGAECRWALRAQPPIPGRPRTAVSASPALGSTKELSRTHSLHGLCSVTTSEPKPCMLQKVQTIMHIQDLPASSWCIISSSESVLVIKKVQTPACFCPLRSSACTWLCMWRRKF